MGQIDLSLVSKAIAITSPASIVSFISLCHFRYFLITHYRPPFASTLFLNLIVPRPLEKDVISVLREVLHRSICSAVEQALLVRHLKFVAANLHTGLSTQKSGRSVGAGLS